MRVILDTNVILSAIFFGGIPGRILNAYRDGEITIVLSPEILEEYRITAAQLAQKFDMEYEALLEWIAIHSEMISSRELAEPVCADPDDDKFIACALASDAKIICSGDKYLLNVNGYQGIEVLKPRPFVDKYL
ncbi:MAG: putative toxin-antitoxin system toxin component, PIN family [Kiritimatiellales bacterium]|nr:putative toxin-antitoxin system toxin component, PIN family [Kiritimatiellota bacterium]MBL7011447.1 putative toxin-antitoxin system toxin component, PIN family [Kiritimatiellales bacterium]